MKGWYFHRQGVDGRHEIQVAQSPHARVPGLGYLFCLHDETRFSKHHAFDYFFTGIGPHVFAFASGGADGHAA
jgi:hypothetical protein